MSASCVTLFRRLVCCDDRQTSFFYGEGKGNSLRPLFLYDKIKQYAEMNVYKLLGGVQL